MYSHIEHMIPTLRFGHMHTPAQLLQALNLVFSNILTYKTALLYTCILPFFFAKAPRHPRSALGTSCFLLSHLCITAFSEWRYAIFDMPAHSTRAGDGSTRIIWHSERRGVDAAARLLPQLHDRQHRDKDSQGKVEPCESKRDLRPNKHFKDKTARFALARGAK